MPGDPTIPSVAAICVYPALIADAKEALKGSTVKVASVATGGHPESPSAGTILREVFWHSIALAVMVGLLVMLQAYVWTSVVPK